MRYRTSPATYTGRRQRLWPVTLLLFIAVALPVTCVLWFMSRAVQNERLAVQQRLTESYQGHLRSAVDGIRTGWRERISAIEEAAKREEAPEAFARVVQSGLADSVLFFRDDRLVYPDGDRFSEVTAEFRTPLWDEARILEQGGNNWSACAEAYGKIVEESNSNSEKAQAFLGQARCLNKAGNTAAAIHLLTETFSDIRYRNVMDSTGRLVSPNALLLALQLMQTVSHPDFEKTALMLVEWLNDYRTSTMPSGQRRFLMRQLQALWTECPDFPTAEAEDMAAFFGDPEVQELGFGRLQQTKHPDIWAYRTLDRSAIALFRRENMSVILSENVLSLEPVPGILLQIREPGASSEALLTAALGETFPAWKLVLNLQGPDPFQVAAGRNTVVYLWTGILMTAVIVTIALFTAGYLRRQIRLTRLKNDLIATVSHELKTPLASMRLLVDTLLDGQYRDTQQTFEYLQIISRENARLSNLIEEFLTYSRMERNKTTFDLKPLQAIDFIQPAVASVSERLKAPGCRFNIDLAPDLPGVRGDRDALITVVVNLLDNALKYSGEEKKIELRGRRHDGYLCLEVEDNGIGFSRNVSGKIFDRFFQVDRSLAKDTGGCGLGLSIVRFIISAHGGEITAESKPGIGSMFTVMLPVL
jgi:signal transduction histidine kinase